MFYNMHHCFNRHLDPTALWLTLFTTAFVQTYFSWRIGQVNYLVQLKHSVKPFFSAFTIKTHFSSCMKGHLWEKNTTTKKARKTDSFCPPAISCALLITKMDFYPNISCDTFWRHITFLWDENWDLKWISQVFVVCFVLFFFFFLKKANLLQIFFNTISLFSTRNVLLIKNNARTEMKEFCVLGPQ